VEAQLQGAFLVDVLLQGADLAQAQLQGAQLRHVDLQGADLKYAQLQGAFLAGVKIGGADFTKADLALSSLQSLSLSPLDEETYKEVEDHLTDTLRDEPQRVRILKQLKKVVGRSPQLKAVHSADQVLCDDVRLFPSCITPEQIGDYVQAHAAFLGKLGCNDAAIARNVVSRPMWEGMDDPLPMQMAFAKRFAAIQEKDCPGWAALPADQKDKLRKLAVEEPSVRLPKDTSDHRARSQNKRAPKPSRSHHLY